MKVACERCESPLAAEDLRCAVCGLPVPPSPHEADRAVARVLRCDECGAAVDYDVEARAPKCAFCGAVAHLEETRDPIERAEAHLPFRVDRPTAEAALGAWLRGLGWFRPGDLVTKATLHSLTPLWWVGWTFDVDALVSWAADSNAGARRSAWAPHAGRSPLTLRRVLVSASRGLSTEEAGDLADAYDLATAMEGAPASDGAVVERFDVQRSAARATVTRAVEDLSRAHARGWIPGSRYRHLHVSVLPRRLRTRRLAFPAYVLAYRYRERVYRAVVHGQDAGRVLGTAPWSLRRIAVVAAGGLALLFLAVWAIVLTV